LKASRIGRAFLESCRQIVPKKPFIVLKAGRSESGAKAAALPPVRWPAPTGGGWSPHAGEGFPRL
jgi:hypothetical protein